MTTQAAQLRGRLRTALDLLLWQAASARVGLAGRLVCPLIGHRASLMRMPPRVPGRWRVRVVCPRCGELVDGRP